MKKSINFLLIIFIITILSMNNFGLSGDFESDLKFFTQKELISDYLKTLKESRTINEEYTKNENYQKIVNLGEEAIPILIEMNKNNELDEETGLIAADVIQDISKINIEEEYNLNWNKPEEFFELWDSVHGESSNTNKPNEILQNEKVIKLFEKYPDFAENIKRSNIDMPLPGEMIPQGITVYKEYFIITSYSQDNKNSKIYVLNKKGHIVNEITLDTNSHVGAISYDEKNNLLWIPENDGLLNAYDAENILKEKEIEYKYQFDNISTGLTYYLNKLKKEIAYLCVKDNYIYIGSFDDKETGLIKQYEIVLNELNEIELVFIKEFKIPPKVQGLEFVKVEDESYMILSISYGRKNSSFIYIYKYDDETLDYGNSSIKKVVLKFPPLLEQVVLSKDNLYSIFESNANEYSNCEEKVGTICIFDLNKIIAKWHNLEKTEEATK